MADSRNTALVPQGFFNKNHRKKNKQKETSNYNPRLGLGSLLTTSSLFMLSQLQGAAALTSKDISHGLELSSNTWYQFTYDGLRELIGMTVSLIENCSIAFTGDLPANTTFEYAATPQCTQNGVPGPSMEIAVEAGKNLTSSLVECVNRAMLDSCNKYYNSLPSTSSDGDNTIKLMFIVGAVGIGLLCACIIGAVWCARSNNNSYSSGYTGNTSYSTYSTFGWLGGHHHSHYGSSSSSSSSSSSNNNSSNNHAENVGVTWNFGKSPV